MVSDGVRLKDKKRRAILRAAVEVFRAEGFDNASMDCIADTARVSKRTVYNHFASKDSLFAAIVEHLRDSPSAMQEFAYAPEAPLEGQLAEIARRIIEFHCAPESRCLARVIVSRLLQAPHLAKDMFAGGKLFESSLVRWIDRARRDGRLRQLDATIAARQFLALLETFTFWPQLLKETPDPSPEEAERIISDTVAMFLATYSAPSPLE